MEKKRGIAFLVFFAAASLLFPQSDDRKTALVIGNSAYKTSPLKNPATDARDLSQALRELGFEVVTLVDVDHERMFNAIRDFGKELTKGGVGLFFYAGHGMQVKGANYLIPVDADIQSEDAGPFQAVDAGLVLGKMESAGNRLNIVMMDACRDNPFAKSFRSSSRGLSVLEAPRGSLVVYATAPGSVAADGSGRNGIFTTALLNNIRTPGIDAELMLRRVRQEVMNETSNAQIPWTSSSLTGSFFFAGKAEGAEPVQPAARPPAPASSGKARTGELFIATDPMDAEVTVDGVKKGTSPVMIADVPLQKAIVVEARKGNMTARREIVLDKTGLTETSLVLETQRGNLFIQSPERNVTVYLDGGKLGDFGSGLFKNVDAGRRTVELKGQGLYWKGEVEVTADSTAQLSARPYEVGVLRYELPSEYGVSVRVDGDGYSKTVSGSGVLENLPVGLYRVTASGGGYAEERAELNVNRWTEAVFQPYKTGTVIIETIPSGADVYVGGQFRGTTPLTLTGVDRGSRTVTAKLKGYEDATQGVEVQGGKTVSVNVVMKQERPKLPENMVFVQGGTFQMGDTFGDGSSDEKPVHTVTVSGFSMGKYEVTQKEWREVMGTSPSNFKGDDLPVEQVTWYDAVQYCNKLGAMKGLDPCYTINGTNVTCDFSKNGFRLPTEAEWEFAAKGGTKSSGYKYAGGNSVDSVGWYDGNSGNKTHSVGTRQANELGLYDMTGNVWEWCWDWKGDYASGSQTDPTGAVSGSARVLRGGSWYGFAWGGRASRRNYSAPGGWFDDFGFRVLARAR